VHLIRAVSELSSQNNDFGDDELGDTSRVTKGRVENSNSMLCSKLEIDLVGPDAEASNDKKVLCLTQDLLRELGF
jgi:hypothetical protein